MIVAVDVTDIARGDRGRSAGRLIEMVQALDAALPVGSSLDFDAASRR